MAQTRRLFRSFYRLLFPVILLLFFALAAAAVWLVYTVSRPPQTSYLVTPEKYGQFSARGAQVTDETWRNADGTSSRGWLLRGSQNEPAVIFLHQYGADRSHVLDLAIKLNEASNFTVLMPDIRGHGANPTVPLSSFGGCESDDVLSAVEFLRGLKTSNQADLVGSNIGVYGVEMGALAALGAASKNPDIKALALDSVPTSSDEILASGVGKRFPFAVSLTSKLADVGTFLYFYNGCYWRGKSCDLAKSVENRQVLLLAGLDAPNLQESTGKLDRCFPNSTRVDSRTDLNPSGVNLMTASLEQSATYHQRIIEFFKTSLSSQ